MTLSFRKQDQMPKKKETLRLNIFILLLHKSNPRFLISDQLSFDELVCVRKRKFIFREISLFRAIHVNYGLAQHSVRTGNKKSATGASSENYFLFRQNYRACKMRCNYAGMKLPSAICEENKNKISSQVTSPMQLQNRKFKVVNWEGTAAKCTT